MGHSALCQTQIPKVNLEALSLEDVGLRKIVRLVMGSWLADLYLAVKKS